MIGIAGRPALLTIPKANVYKKGNMSDLPLKNSKMTYKNYRTGIFRRCIFLTVLFEVLIELGTYGYPRYPFGIRISHTQAIIFTPVFIWGTYHFGFWIYDGFLGKKKKKE